MRCCFLSGNTSKEKQEGLKEFKFTFTLPLFPMYRGMFRAGNVMQIEFYPFSRLLFCFITQNWQGQIENTEKLF